VRRTTESEIIAFAAMLAVSGGYTTNRGIILVIGRPGN